MLWHIEKRERLTSDAVDCFLAEQLFAGTSHSASFTIITIDVSMLGLFQPAQTIGGSAEQC